MEVLLRYPSKYLGLLRIRISDTADNCIVRKMLEYGYTATMCAEIVKLGALLGVPPAENESDCRCLADIVLPVESAFANLMSASVEKSDTDDLLMG